MLFSKDVLFIHVPKTGGTSIREYLTRVLPRPVYYTYPTALPEQNDSGVVWIQGIQHETLAEAREVVARYGYDLQQFPLILVVMRNPYAIEVSHYAFFNAGNAPHNPNSTLALNEDFEGFACKNTTHAGARATDKFYRLDGTILPNLRILRLEHLAEELRAALQTIGLAVNLDLPHLNKSHHANFASYYTRTSEEAVYQRYKWVFNAGFYKRLRPRETSRLSAVEQELRDVKQTARDLRAEYNRLQELWYASDRWANELEEAARWAHELEVTIQAQEEMLRSFRRVLAPITPLVHLVLAVKKRLPA